MNEESVSTEGDGRDARGRFAKGNRIARGNPSLRRQHALQQAVREACDEGDLVAVMAGLLDAARKGDHIAARLLLEHAVGRPREAEPLLDLGEIPDLSTAGGHREALQLVAAACARGDVDLGSAQRFVDVLGHVAEATLLVDLQARLAALEARPGWRRHQ